MKEKILVRVRRYLARLFSGEGKPLSPQSEAKQLPCNYYSEF